MYMNFGGIRGLVVLMVLMVLVVPMMILMIMFMVVLMVMLIMLMVLWLWLCSVCRVVYVGTRRRRIRDRWYEGRDVLFSSNILRNCTHNRYGSSSWLGMDMVVIRVLMLM